MSELKHLVANTSAAEMAVVTGNAPRSSEQVHRLDRETSTAEELYRQMLAIYPHRVNPGALWLSAQSAKA